MPCISSMTSLFPAYLSNSAGKRQSCTTAAINLSNGCGAIGATAARIKATAVRRLCHSGRMGVVLYCFEAGKTLVGSGEPLSERLASKPKTASAIAVNGPWAQGRNAGCPTKRMNTPFIPTSIAIPGQFETNIAQP